MAIIAENPPKSPLSRGTKSLAPLLIKLRLLLPPFLTGAKREDEGGWGGDPDLSTHPSPHQDQRSVTNSSAVEGWIPTVASKSFLVAPILIAIAIP